MRSDAMSVCKIYLPERIIVKIKIKKVQSRSKKSQLYDSVVKKKKKKNKNTKKKKKKKKKQRGSPPSQERSMCLFGGWVRA